MAKICIVCGGKIGMLSMKTPDGFLCSNCMKKHKDSSGLVKGLKEIETGFKATKSILGKDQNSGIEIDIKLKKICMIKSIGIGSYDRKIYDYKDVLSSEIFENGDSVIKSNRVSQIGGAILGNLIIGPIGAIIGGLSGKKESSDIVNRIDLRVVVNNIENPSYIINISNTPINKKSSMYESLIGVANEWHNTLDIIIKQADEDDKKKQPTASSVSIADELKKMAELKEKGIISDIEFQEHKKKLLNL